MLEVSLRGQIKAICTVIVICDLFGNNFYSGEEIFDLCNSRNIKLLRSIELNKEYLYLALQNQELKVVLNELLKNVLEYDRKKIGTVGSVENPFSVIYRMKYNMK